MRAIKHHALPILFCLAAAPLAAQEAEAPSWPHWRGPDRDGISHETGWQEYGPDEPLWTAEVGLGYSCFAIADGQLFTLGFDEEAGIDRLFCLDALTGEERWRHEWPSEILNNFHGGGTLTTPSIEGERLYVSRRFGTATCFARESGEVLWERDFKAELGLEELPFHGFSASPLLVDGKLFLVFGDVLACCDRDTGELLWRVGEPGGDGGYSNLTPFELGERPMFAMMAGYGLVVYARDDGEELWRYPWKPEGGGVNCCTPIVDGDRVFISTAYGLGAALVQLKPGGETEALWTTVRFRNKVSSCVLHEGYVYGFDESMLKCIALADGEEQWRVRGLGMGTPALADGKLIVLSSKGELIIGEATPEHGPYADPVKVLDDGVYWTPPVLLNGLIYCRNSLGQLVCLDHRPTDLIGIGSGKRYEPVEPPSAEFLFERHAGLVGGAKLRQRRSMTIQGEIEITGAGITRTPMTIRRMAPDRWHLEYSLGPYGTVQRGFDGTVGWVLDPFYGNEVLEGDRLLEAKETLGFLHGIEWRDAYGSMETPVHLSMADGRVVWGVKTATAGGTERGVLFDADTGLRYRRTAKTESEETYSDWRDFDGVKLPGITTRLLTDTGAEETYYIESVTWDDVDESVFERPPEVALLLRTPEEVAADEQRLREAYGDWLGRYRSDLPPNDEGFWRLYLEDGGLVLGLGDGIVATLSGPDGGGRFQLPYAGMSIGLERAEDDSLHLSFRGPQGSREIPKAVE